MIFTRDFLIHQHESNSNIALDLCEKAVGREFEAALRVWSKGRPYVYLGEKHFTDHERDRVLHHFVRTYELLEDLPQYCDRNGAYYKLPVALLQEESYDVGTYLE